MSEATPKDHARQTASTQELLASLEETPLQRHPEVFSALHAKLTETLTREQGER